MGLNRLLNYVRALACLTTTLLLGRCDCDLRRGRHWAGLGQHRNAKPHSMHMQIRMRASLYAIFLFRAWQGQGLISATWRSASYAYDAG